MIKISSDEQLIKLNELQALYAIELQQTIDKWTVSIDTILFSSDQSQHIQMDELKGLSFQSHQLAGSASNYGYPEVSRLARQFELKVNRQRNLSTPVPMAIIGELSKLIVNIRHQATKSPRKIALPKIDEPISKPEEITARQKNIIIVDDDEELTKLISIQLSQFNYQVHCLNDPNTLGDKLLSVQPDAVIMDIVFPNTEDLGFDVISRLSRENSLSCPVIFSSARDDYQARMGAAIAKADGYLVKPLNIIEAANMLDHLTSKKVAKFKILIIGSYEVTVERQALLLSESGFEILKLTHPEMILKCLAEFEADVILIEVELETGSGFDLATMIHQTAEYLQIPIAFYMSKIFDKVKYTSKNYPADDVYDVTVDKHTLVNGLRAKASRARNLQNLQHQLKSSEARFRGFSEMAGSALVVSDEHEKIVYWNQAATDLFGYTKLEIIGQPIVTLIPSELSALHHDAFAKRVEATPKRRKTKLTSVGITKQGQRVPIETSLGSWQLQGKTYISAIINDITQRLEIESQLTVAKNNAEKANLAKSAFLAAMSHELRTPMNAILGFSQMLKLNRKETLSTTQGECVKYILSSGEHLLTLINEVLDLAKIESGKVDFFMVDLKIEKLMVECIALVEPLCSKHTVKVVPASSDSAVQINADHTRLKQVLLNLLSNAIKYNKEGGEVIIAYQLLANSMLRIAISDSGIGISKPRQTEIFQPFNRLGAEATEIEGTGIGLSVTKRLVESMGGEIGFESVESQGSTFWLEFPIVQIAQQSTVVVKRPNAQQTPAQIFGKVLYVEDNPGNMALMKMAISQLDGIKFLAARDAELGIELALQEQPDLIILDINLPGINGIEALQQLRQMKITKTTPVIALSASASAQNVQNGLSAGFSQYLTKPIQIEQIQNVVRKILVEQV